MPDSLVDFRIHRIRNSYEFENPFLMKCIEEITLINTSDRELRLISYEIDGFRPKLEVKNSNGENLIFYDSENTPYDYLSESVVRQIAQLDDDSPEILENNVPHDENHSIIIKFKENLQPHKITTVFLEYIKEFDPLEPSIETIDIPLQSSDTRYVSIRIAKDYVSQLNCIIFDNQGNINQYPIPYENDWISIRKSESFFHIILYYQEPNELLKIGIEQSLKPRDRNWFDAGLAIGLIALITNPIYAVFGKNTIIPLIVSINTIAITYLIVTKGWIFTKDLEKVVTMCQSTPYRIDYPKYYLYMIILLFVEIVGILLLSILSPIVSILPSLVVTIQMSIISTS